MSFTNVSGGMIQYTGGLGIAAGGGDSENFAPA